MINSVNKPLCPRIKKWQIVTSKIHGNRKKKLDVFLSNPKKQNMHRALFSISLPKVSRSTTTSSYNLNVPCSEKSPLLLSSRGRVPPAPALRCSSDRRFNGRGRIKHYNDILKKKLREHHTITPHPASSDQVCGASRRAHAH